MPLSLFGRLVGWSVGRLVGWCVLFLCGFICVVFLWFHLCCVVGCCVVLWGVVGWGEGGVELRQGTAGVKGRVLPRIHRTSGHRYQGHQMRAGGSNESRGQQ